MAEPAMVTCTQNTPVMRRKPASPIAAKKFIRSLYSSMTTRFYLPKQDCIQILRSSCCFLIYRSGSCSQRDYLTPSERHLCPAKPNLPVVMEAVFQHGSGVWLTQPSQTLLSGKPGRHHSTLSHLESVFFLLSLPR